MKSICALAILSASRHILRIRRRRADWRKAFVAQLALAMKVLVASVALRVFCVLGASL